MKVFKNICCIISALLFSAILHAQDSHWNVNIYDYQYDMTVYAKMSMDGEQIENWEAYEVAAFVNGECRGVAVVQERNGMKWLHLRIRSNSSEGETITFRAYNKSTDKIIRFKETILFESQGLVGLPSDPVELTSKSYTLGDVNDDGKINITDVTAILAYMAGTAPSYFNDAAADVNTDGRINISDVTGVLQIMANN